MEGDAQMSKLNFMGYVLMLILIITMVGLFDSARNIAANPDIITSNNEKEQIDSIIIENTLRINEFGNYTESIDRKESLAKDRDNPLFIDSGFDFVKFIGKIPVLLGYSATSGFFPGRELAQGYGAGALIIYRLIS